jgi:hypothetical protein
LEAAALRAASASRPASFGSRRIRRGFIRVIRVIRGFVTSEVILLNLPNLLTIFVRLMSREVSEIRGIRGAGGPPDLFPGFGVYYW